MKLQEVEQKGQFKAYYEANNLQTIDEKISDLTRTMKIRATRCDDTETKDEELAGLEELVLLGYWRAYC